LGIGSAVSLGPAYALAQDAVPPPPAAPPAATAPPPPAVTTAPPMPMPPPPPPGGVSPAQAATPPVASEAMPATREEKLPPIDVGAWVRTGMRFQGTNPRNLDGVSTDGAFPIYGELHAGGKIHKMISLTLNINAGGAGGPLAIEDAIIGFDPMPEFHVWLGQMLVPVDRPNYGGPFFAIPWNFYPGVFVVGGKGFDSSLSGAVVVTPKEGPTGRNVGAAVWGDVGAFQYALGAFLPSDANSGTLFSGRLAVNFLDHESGYFGNASYFGDKNIAAISLGGQYQHDAVTQSIDYFELSADGLLELKYGDGGGYVTGEVGYNKYTDHSNESQVGTLPYNVTDTVFALAAIATPKLGPGALQPNFRYQIGMGDSSTPKVWSVDAGLNYLLMGPAMRLFAVYQHVELGQSIYGNQVQLGAQAIFF
ncbi:MAG TPA: hypothetical protein VMH39_02400, partial [Gemmatimonadaceae bacterium]|nr:hypothetical protein [Gemmatimonadaceae bacterium]